MLNSVNVVGRMTKDPEVKMINGDTAVVNFGIAVNRPYKDKDSGEYEADFFNCAAFKQTAEFMGSYVKKGDLIGVNGSLTTRTYEKEGQKHYVTEIRADKVTLEQSFNKNGSSASHDYKSADEVKKARKTEWDLQSVGLDEAAKTNLQKRLHAKYQPILDKFENDNPF